MPGENYTVEIDVRLHSMDISSCRCVGAFRLMLKLTSEEKGLLSEAVITVPHMLLRCTEAGYKDAGKIAGLDSQRESSMSQQLHR